MPNTLGPLEKIFHIMFLSFLLAPLVVVVLVSFNDGPYLHLPTGWLSLRWYKQLIVQKEFRDAFYYSLSLAVVSASFSLIVSFPGALAIVRHKFRGRDVLTGVIMGSLAVPSIVFGVGFLRVSSMIGLNGTFIALVLAHSVILIPVLLRMIISGLATVGTEREWAAASLGASNRVVFFRVTVPAILPAVAGGWMLSFIHSIDEMSVSIFVSSPANPTLPVKLFNAISLSADPTVTAVSTLVIALTIVALLLVDRIYGVEKLLAGSGSGGR
jgi:putative spermidine/putrescine transport system permease protein